MTGIRLLPFGDRGMLVEVDSLEEVLALHARLAALRPEGVVDLVPAARTVLVHVDPTRLSLAAARAWIARAGEVTAPPARTGAVVELPIVYDGPDLDEVAEALGIRPDELIERHAACEWTVAFTGFAPGFGYLASADWPYDIARRASPRTRVPAGAVGLAGAFAGAYPRETPGGWQLIGTTPAPLFDPAGDPPALLAPGARVRFVAAPASPDPRLHAAARAAADAPNPVALPAVAGPAAAAVPAAGRAAAAAAGAPAAAALPTAPAVGLPAAAAPDPTAPPGPAGPTAAPTTAPVPATPAAPASATPTAPTPTPKLQWRTETASADRSLGAPLQSRGQGQGEGQGQGPARGGRGSPAFAAIEPGLRATLQDQGRPGHATEGIAASGAADRAALRTANRLVGNPEDAAGIEITMGGFRAVARADLHVVVAGAWGPIRIDGRAVDPYTAHPWSSGTELHVDWFAHGARGYLAVRGGLAPADARAIVDSFATDTLSGLGPAALRAGDVVTLAGTPLTPIPPDDLHPWSPPADALLEIALAPGPRADWFAAAPNPAATAAAATHAADIPTALFETIWTVSNQADRVGIRLDGPPLTRTRAGELPSEGMLPGAIQVPPDGHPVILGPDGPVTGGYPVIAVVADASRDALAQARPGTRLRFRHAH